jgi:WD40 repeat protein/serine/threonine protein kinase/tetratricopeptide (TPR) repeat protein
MPLDPKRVQAVFLAAVEYHEPAARAAVLDAECSGDSELRQRVEVLLCAHDQFDESLDVPLAGLRQGTGPLTGPERPDREGTPDAFSAAGSSNPTSDSASNRSVAADAGGASTERTNRAAPAVEGYEVLGELGRGGMGVVYRARQVLLNRPCVLKMILAGVHADDESVVRFLAEARTVARLQHPNVVEIHHIGVADDLPFFELEYVEGGSLEKRLDGTPWPPRRAAALVEALTRGVAEAHRLGIVHRDLKPGNVLLAADGTPKVTDFGLAKSLTTDSGLTRTDSIMGSPGYMAPEQAEGKARHVGPLADVYALGAILYELLTGRPPFRGATLLETLEQVKTTEPVPPSRLVPGLPRDAETIALKCLQKEPGKRYDSAAALAADLHRFLGREPIVARPVPPWERAVKWARRRPAIATLVVAVLLLLASLLGLGIWSYAEINRSLTKAERLAETEARANAKAQEQTKIANQRAEDLAWEDYINRVNRAYREVQDDNVALAEDLLQGCPVDRRSWEWHYVNRLCHPERLSLGVPAGAVIAIACSPDGRRIATGTGGAFSTGRGGPNVVLWDRETGQELLTLRGSEHHIWSLAFSPDGTRLAVGGTDPQVQVWDANTGNILWAKQEPRLPQAMSLAFSPDGRSLAVGFGLRLGDGVHSVKFYEAATGQEADTFPGPKGGVNDLALHPDGRHLAVAGSGLVEVWDVRAHTKVLELRGHSNWVLGVAYSPDGKWLATGGYDGTIKLWDAATGVERETIRGHEGFVLDLAFSPDAAFLVSTSEDRSVRLWEVPTGRSIGVFHGHTDHVHAVAFTPDGREVASGGRDGTLKLWHRRTSLPVVIEGVAPVSMGLWYRRDGRRLVISPVIQGQHARQGWDPSTGELDPTLTGIDRSKLQEEYLPYPVQIAPGHPIPSATSPDAKFFARGSPGSTLSEREQRIKNAASTVEVLELATGRVLYNLVGHTHDVHCIAFSPDGRRIATGSSDRSVKLWDTATGRDVFTLRGHANTVVAVVFSPDGYRIVSGAYDETARVWDATPLPAAFLQVQEARYQQKRKELEERRDNSGGENTAGAGNDLSRLRQLQWERSAEDFGKNIGTYPNSLGLRRQHILALVIPGNKAGVRRACENLLKRFGGTTDPAQANDVAWCCVLAPDAVADPKAPVRLAEAALVGQAETGSARGDVLKTLGATLYRAGRFEEAIHRLDESIQTRGDGGDPRAFAFLALAHHRLGHRDQAERWLAKLLASQPNEGFDFSRYDVEIRILRREAESLIMGGRPAASPTSDPAPIKKATAPPAIEPESASTTRSQPRPR